MNFKNIIPIKTHIHTHTHLINTCSNKFGATLGLKNVSKSKNCFRKSVDIMCILLFITNTDYIIQPLQYDCTHLG